MTWFDEQLILLVQLEESFQNTAGESEARDREISLKLNQQLLFNLETVHLEETSNTADLHKWICAYPDSLGLHHEMTASSGLPPCIFKIFVDDKDKSKLDLLPFLLEEANECGFESCLSLNLMHDLNVLEFLISATQYGYDKTKVVEILRQLEIDVDLIYEEDLQTIACASLSKAVIQYLNELDPNSLLRKFTDSDFNSFEKVWSIQCEEDAEEYGWKENEGIKDEEDFPSLIFFVATRGLVYLKTVLPIFLETDIGRLFVDKRK